ncbi:MAG: hypothetical protein FJX72_07030, partial [Armatimonadetes bacterium]|nr:hypothetical protein [Armatimonadota bacterium]
MAHDGFQEADVGRRRVVVTGIGLVTSLGLDIEAFWQSLMQGRSGVSLISTFDTADFATRIAAEIRDFEPERYMDRKEARRMDRFAQFAVAG